jgi:hypothetical protein
MIQDAKAYSTMLYTIPNLPLSLHWLMTRNLPDALTLLSSSEAECESIAKLKSLTFSEKPKLQVSQLGVIPGKKLGSLKEVENEKVCFFRSSDEYRMMLIGF